MGRDVGVPEAEEAVRLVVPPPVEAAQQLGRGGLAQPWGIVPFWLILAGSSWLSLILVTWRSSEPDEGALSLWLRRVVAGDTFFLSAVIKTKL